MKGLAASLMAACLASGVLAAPTKIMVMDAQAMTETNTTDKRTTTNEDKPMPEMHHTPSKLERMAQMHNNPTVAKYMAESYKAPVAARYMPRMQTKDKNIMVEEHKLKQRSTSPLDVSPRQAPSDDVADQMDTPSNPADESPEELGEFDQQSKDTQADELKADMEKMEQRSTPASNADLDKAEDEKALSDGDEGSYADADDKPGADMDKAEDMKALSDGDEGSYADADDKPYEDETYSYEEAVANEEADGNDEVYVEGDTAETKQRSSSPSDVDSDKDAASKPGFQGTPTGKKPANNELNDESSEDDQQDRNQKRYGNTQAPPDPQSRSVGSNISDEKEDLEGNCSRSFFTVKRQVEGQDVSQYPDNVVKSSSSQGYPPSTSSADDETQSGGGSNSQAISGAASMSTGRGREKSGTNLANAASSASEATSMSPSKKKSQGNASSVSSADPDGSSSSATVADEEGYIVDVMDEDEDEDKDEGEDEVDHSGE